jgi:hypothetical protein
MITLRTIATAVFPVLLCVCATGSAEANSSGQVVDRQFLPLAGASVCLVEGSATGPCTETGADGFYTLPDSDMEIVQISLQGYLVVQVAAGAQDKPIQLKLAAAFLVLVKDSGTSESIETGVFMVLTPSGARSGPFPVHADGTLVGSFPPGPIFIEVDCPGYTQEEPVQATIESGFVSQITVKVISAMRP